jgi:hypothetical protein
MANELTFFQQNDLVIPDFLKDFMSEEANIVPRAGVPSLSFSGGKWATVIDGEKTMLERKNADGDMEPVGVIRVIILDYAQKRGRTYYEGDYNPDKVSAPVCWSANGVAPDASVEAPVSDKCATCPMAVKGAKINALGKAVVACEEHRLIAVQLGGFDHPALRLKIKVTSDFDGQSPDMAQEGWFAFRNYLDYLRARGVTRTAAVVTKMKFHAGKNYPKILFSPDKLLTDPATVAKLRDICASDAVKELVNETWTPNGVDGTLTREDPAPAQRHAPVETAPAAEPFITPEMVDDGAAAKKAEAAKKAAATKAANAAKAKALAEAAEAVEQAAKAKAAPVDSGDDDGDVFGESAYKAVDAEVMAEIKAPPAPVVAKAAASSDVPDDVAALLSEWAN